MRENKILLHESRLKNTFPSSKIEVGNVVKVKDKMGASVVYGEVLSSTYSGLVIKEDNGNVNFYQSDFYLFATDGVTTTDAVGEVICDISLDSRVERKIAAMEAGEPQPEGGQKKKVDDDDDDDEPRDKPKKDEPEDEPEKKDDGSVVDVDKLPPDIKQAIVQTHEMDEEQLNSVLSEVGEATMSALKRMNVDEKNLYGLVQKIQQAAAKVLTSAKKAK